MITQLDLLPSLQPSQDWIRTQLIDGLINPLMWGKVRRGAAAARGAEERASLQEGPGGQGQRNRENWGRKGGIHRGLCRQDARGRAHSPPCSLSTEHLGWDLSGVSEAAALPILLESSFVTPRPVAPSQGCTLNSPGELSARPVCKVCPSPTQSEPLGCNPVVRSPGDSRVQSGWGAITPESH